MAESLRPSHAWMKEPYPVQLEQAVKELRKGLESANIDKAPQYNKVAVLMFHWDDQAPTSTLPKLEDELALVFRDIYGFIVEQYVLEQYPRDLNDPQRVLLDRLSSFWDAHEGDQNLLIIVYSGHSTMSPANALHLHGDENDDDYDEPPWSQMVDWPNMSHAIERARGQKLLIFDSCAPTWDGTHDFAIECLAASATHSNVSPAPEHSLTHRLTELLRLFDGAPMSVAQIHSHLVHGMDQPNSNLETMPVHLSSESEKSAVIAAMDSGQRAQAQETLAVTQRGARVLVKVSLEDQEAHRSVEELMESLTNQFPNEAGVIVVEACFESKSSLFLLSMPTEIWTCLPENSTFAFVAHVRSHNILSGPGAEKRLAICP